MPARQGLNATLSYPQGKKRRAYRVRVSSVNHGLAVVSEESQARVRHSFYPHRLSSSRFGILVDLNGHDEYANFSNWLAAYAKIITASNVSNFPSMTISVPSRSFLKIGVPVSGYDWGDHVGSMVWKQAIIFETSQEITDRGKPHVSYFTNSAQYKEPAAAYFYPQGTQLRGNQIPDGIYDKVISSDSSQEEVPKVPYAPGYKDPHPWTGWPNN